MDAGTFGTTSNTDRGLRKGDSILRKQRQLESFQSGIDITKIKDDKTTPTKMKATELRIGNHIVTTTDDNGIVVTVDAEYLAKQARYDADPNAEEFSQGWNHEGIPLTIGRIHDFGLVPFTDDAGITGVSISRCLHLLKSEIYWNLAYREYGNRIYNDLHTRIKYVHQLQNLVYLLTDRELECHNPGLLIKP